jgi:hypothetical protein
MTPKFLDPLLSEAIPPNKWKLTGRFAYRTLVTGKPLTITVPVGFVNDLASIPQPLMWLFPVNGRHRWAAVIHDWLYSKKGILGERQQFTRKECDLIFLEGMKVMGVPWWKRRSMYRGVRAGGWVFWSNK